jgi:uncharacterized protein (DUF302 family)
MNGSKRERSKAKLGTRVTLRVPHEDAVARVTESLKVEGFGVLTAIDVRDTLRKKLDVDFPPYTILGACNPPLAHQALQASADVGLLLPCNVTVREIAPGRSEVSIVGPRAMLELLDEPGVAAVAEEAAARLDRVARSLEALDAAV